MIKKLSTSQKIVIIGPRTNIGKCIWGQLAQHDIPVTLICPLDIHQEAGKAIYYNNHKLFTQPIDLFNFNSNHIIFICDKKIFPLLHRCKKYKSNWWIDCTHSQKDAVCIIPSVNGSLLKSCHPKWICNPSSTVIELVHILYPIIQTFNASSIQLTLLMGTIFQPQDMSEKLITQIRHFLTNTPLPNASRYPQLAFNIIPDFFIELAQIIRRQMYCFIDIPIDIDSCFVPVIRGTCIHVELTLRKECSPTHILKKLKTLPNVRTITERNLLGLNDIITETNVFIVHPKIRNKTLSFWYLQDVLQKGMGTNAVHLVDMLKK